LLVKPLNENLRLKYKIANSRISYNNKTGMYQSGSGTYTRYDQAKENKWKCEKCYNHFATLKKLKLHKIDYHSY